MSNTGKKKGSPWGSIIIALVVLCFALPDLMAVLFSIAALLAPFGIVAFFIIRILKKNTAPKPKNTYSKTQDYSEPEPMKDFLADECPNSFCFHKDRGEHHLKKGKEIDPWDRPDIDISKYQRR